MMAGIMQFIEGRKDLNWSMHLLLHLHISVLITWVQTQNAATPLISEPSIFQKADHSQPPQPVLPCRSAYILLIPFFWKTLTQWVTDMLSVL